MKARERRAAEIAADLIHVYLEMSRLPQSSLGSPGEVMVAVLAGAWVLAGKELGESEDRDN